MLISPPFLPPNNGAAADAWLATAMTPAENEGAYPVTNGLAWHGGMHLVSAANLPVRAIADGTVVYVRAATARNTNPADPLNYHAGEAVAGWTSNGCVVIQHDTEIGAGANAVVRFFSIYMHLEEIVPAIVRGRPVYRKDALGQPGLVNGRPGRLHMEIICDDANLARLVGRASGNLPLTAHGRHDAVYGDTYVHVPAGAVFYATRPPHPHHPDAAITLPAVAHTTAEALFVGIRRAGHAWVSSWRANGELLGAPVIETDDEYAMYNTSLAMKTHCPSAAFELLRFGRVLSDDVLAPAATPHWRHARYPGGQGWVNLAAPGTHVFSDADFPHWLGWVLVDDSADQDSRMDSALIRGWLDTNGDGKVTPAEARAQLASAAVKEKLKRAICKMPTEWRAATIDARWGWLKTASAENPDKLSDADFAAFKAHVTALCFWDDAGLTISPNHWHFQPREFIGHFRQCEWYSQHELARCIPRRSLSGNASWAAALQATVTNRASLNVFFRKYIGPNRSRHVHALAQIYIETGVLTLEVEGGLGNGHEYGPFYGRGFMQLTWGDNYKKYGTFKNLPNQAHPTYVDQRITTTSTHHFAAGSAPQRWSPRYDPQVVGTVAQHRADSSGFYWVSKTFRGTFNINRACDAGLTPTEIGFVSWLVNGGPNGYVNRQQFAEPLKNALLDSPWISGTVQVRYPAFASANMAHFPPVPPPFNAQVSVNYERQIP